jgi:hypothetical protein
MSIEARREKKRQYSAAYRAAGRAIHTPYDRNRQRSWHLSRKYGITLERFEEMLEEQGGACAICRTDDPGGSGTWHVDHDHETGRVRGLLCVRCNVAIGLLHDDLNLLRQAISYIEGDLS